MNTAETPFSRRRFLAIGFAMGAGAVLAACGGTGAPSPVASSTTSASPQKASPPAAGSSSPAASKKPAASPAASRATLDEVKFAYSPGIGAAQTFVAVGRGYFRDAGIDLQISPLASGTDLLPQLATSKIDVGHTNINSGTFNALTRGLPLRFVADGGRDQKDHGYTAMVVRKDIVDRGTIKQPSDLKGLKLAVFNKGSTIDMETHLMLDAANLKDGDVEFQYMAFDASVTALANKAIDAALLVEPYVASVVAKGYAVRMWGASDLIGTLQTLLLNYSPDFGTKRNDVAQRFMIAYLRGVRDYMDAVEHGKDFDAIVAMLTKPTGISDPALFKKMNLIVNDRNGKVDVDSLKRQQKWYADNKYVQKIEPVEPFVDTSYVDHAIATLGKQ